MQMPKGSDESWVHKLYSQLATRPHFAKPRLSNVAFIVKHYADAVQYDVAGFLDKNKDTVHGEHVTMLHASELEIVREMFGGPSFSGLYRRGCELDRSQNSPRSPNLIEFPTPLKL